MKKALFDELLASVQEAQQIVRGERRASREFKVDAVTVKELRERTHLSQPQFAALLQIDVGTLRNWEQGRRRPSGTAKALLRAIHKDPEHVLRALVA
jgi:putative transcriptional regulator